MRGLQVIVILALACVFTLGSVLPGSLHGNVGAARADDGGGDGGDGGSDGGDGDDGGGDDGGGDSDATDGDKGESEDASDDAETDAQSAEVDAWRGGGRDARVAPDEIITRNLSARDTAILSTQGYILLERSPLGRGNQVIQRFRIPRGVDLPAARNNVRRLSSGQSADFNAYYRVSEAAHAATGLQGCSGSGCPALEFVKWPVGLAPSACGRPVRVGMVDTGLNPQHKVLRGASLEVIRLSPLTERASSQAHGTAIASLLVGGRDTPVPGLLPSVPLIAVDAFHRQAGDERADAFTLVRALEMLAGRGVRVINLSIAGPPNRVLQDTITRLSRRDGIVIVAAAGNDGPRAAPAYPAAYEDVIAVTAVDLKGRLYRRAGQGEYIDLAAPGVGVWAAASRSGARAKTGTSFAAPFVTAAAALVLSRNPNLSPRQVRDRLLSGANDLGPRGPDTAFGYGLLDMQGRCPS